MVLNNFKGNRISLIVLILEAKFGDDGLLMWHYPNKQRYFFSKRLTEDLFPYLKHELSV